MHLGSQNGAKIDPKMIQNRSRFLRAKKHSSRPSWERLGAILERFGEPPECQNRAVAHTALVFLKINVLEEDKRSRGVLEQTLVNFGPILAPKGKPRGAQEAPKTRPK